MLRLRALFFNYPKCIGPAVVTDDNARLFHGILENAASAGIDLLSGEEQLPGRQ